MQGGVNTVKVLGKRHDIMVYQQPSSEWLAAGNFMGEPLKVPGPTRSAAAKEWREAARYKGADGEDVALSGRTAMFVFMGLTLLFGAVLFGLPVISRGMPY